MRIRALGPLTIEGGSRNFTVTAAKPRSLLALLVLLAPTTVPLNMILEELWPAGAPRSARGSLQTYVLQLRRLLADSAAPDRTDPKQLLITQPGGYQLGLEHCQTDLEQFQQLMSEGISAFELGCYESANNSLGAALELWSGDVLCDVALGPRLQAEVARLNEHRLTCYELHAEAALRLGQHARVTGDLVALNVRYPLREDFCQLLMTAFYRSGRRPQALDAYRRLRQALHDELGLEPSGQLQHLQLAMLREDPMLEQRPADRSPRLT